MTLTGGLGDLIVGFAKMFRLIPTAWIVVAADEIGLSPKFALVTQVDCFVVEAGVVVFVFVFVTCEQAVFGLARDSNPTNNKRTENYH